MTWHAGNEAISQEWWLSMTLRPPVGNKRRVSILSGTGSVQPLKTSLSSSPADALLSRAVSHALRHDPSAYGLILDDYGSVGIQDLIAALQRHSVGWADLNESRLREMIQRASKRRHEIGGDRIRALYGHSIPVRVSKSPIRPPQLLYHGTDASAALLILAEGLRPMERQHTHLSVDVQTAQLVGLRKDAKPVILCIEAWRACDAGVVFYEGNETVWLADHVPAEFVSRSGGQ